MSNLTTNRSLAATLKDIENKVVAVPSVPVEVGEQTAHFLYELSDDMVDMFNNHDRYADTQVGKEEFINDLVMSGSPLMLESF
jgi:hypothetical protein